MRWVVIFLFAFSSQVGFSQLDADRIPFSDAVAGVKAESWIKLPAQDWQAKKAELLKQDRNARKPFQFGYTFDRNYDLKDGRWIELANGDRIWTLAFHSPAAISMNVVWSDFYIPKGGALYIYNEDKTEIIGAYTHRQNNTERTLSSWLIPGEKLIVEYNQPAEVEELPQLTIGKIVHGLLGPKGSEKDLNDSGDCNHDVKCSIGAEIDPMKDHLSRAAGIMLVNGNSFCSSCLINNTARDGTPYVLTANHCMGANPSNIAVRFGWIAEDPICGEETDSENGPEFMIMSGTELVASNGGSDVALLRLNNPIPTEWERVYAGWDRSGVAPDFTFGIHHPSGDIMKVCRDDDPPIKAVNAGAETWEILESGGGWEIGVTEPGSSGSPLFDQAGHIVGQLFGGTAACAGTNDNDEYDYYGRFDVSWDAGADPESRLRDWLDPLQSQVETLSSFPEFNIPDRDLSMDIRVSAEPPSSSCENIEEVDISVSVRNRGRQPMDSILVIWSLDALSFDSIFYNTVIDSGQTVLLVDSVIPFGDSTTLMAELQYTDGEIDSVPENNQDGITFTSPFQEVPSTSTGTLLLTLLTDDFPSETTWEVRNERSGEVIATGGPYGDGGTLYEEQIPIPDLGCYTLDVFDSASDGLCCFFGEGGFALLSPDGDTLGQGAEFTNVASTNFKVQALSFDAALEVISRPGPDEICYDVQNIEIELFIQNLGDSTINEILIEWREDDQVMDTVVLAELAPGEEISLFTSQISASSTFQAEIIDIEFDEVPDNNLVVYQHTDEFSGESFAGDTLVVEIQTDFWPDETSWELANTDGIVISAGGPYQDAGMLFRETILLDPNTCFEFTISDAACDGILDPGEYRLLNTSGEVLFSGGGFDCSEKVSFYTETTTSTQNYQLSEFKLYPNPASHRVRIQPASQVRQVTVYNLQGQPVLETPSPELDVSPFSSGIYFLNITSRDGTQGVLKLVKQ